MPTDLLTTAQAAARLGCHPSSITRAITSGRLAARRYGSQWLIEEEDLERYSPLTDAGSRMAHARERIKRP